MSETEETPKGKAAVVRKAITVAVGVFFFGVVLFIGLVILVAKLASKTGNGAS